MFVRHNSSRELARQGTQGATNLPQISVILNHYSEKFVHFLNDNTHSVSSFKSVMTLNGRIFPRLYRIFPSTALIKRPNVYPFPPHCQILARNTTQWLLAPGIFSLSLAAAALQANEIETSTITTAGNDKFVDDSSSSSSDSKNIFDYLFDNAKAKNGRFTRTKSAHLPSPFRIAFCDSRPRDSDSSTDPEATWIPISKRRTDSKSTSSRIIRSIANAIPLTTPYEDVKNGIIRGDMELFRRGIRRQTRRAEAKFKRYMGSNEFTEFTRGMLGGVFVGVIIKKGAKAITYAFVGGLVCCFFLETSVFANHIEGVDIRKFLDDLGEKMRGEANPPTSSTIKDVFERTKIFFYEHTSTEGGFLAGLVFGLRIG